MRRVREKNLICLQSHPVTFVIVFFFSYVTLVIVQFIRMEYIIMRQEREKATLTTFYY